VRLPGSPSGGAADVEVRSPPPGEAAGLAALDHGLAWPETPNAPEDTGARARAAPEREGAFLVADPVLPENRASVHPPLDREIRK